MPTHVYIWYPQNDINERVYIFMCTNMRAVIWIAISFGYKALLQLGAIFMAFTTRKVNIKALNDTKEIYAIIYINTLIITVLIVTEFALKSHREAYVTLYGLAIFAEATLFLALTFIPKVYGSSCKKYNKKLCDHACIIKPLFYQRRAGSWNLKVYLRVCLYKLRLFCCTLILKERKCSPILNQRLVTLLSPTTLKTYPLHWPYQISRQR